MRLTLLKKANISKNKNPNKIQKKNAFIMKLIGLPVILLIISSAIKLPKVMQ